MINKDEPTTQDQLLTYADVAQLLGWKTVQPVRKLVKRKLLKATIINHKTRRIRRSDLDLFLKMKTPRILPPLR